MITGNFFLNNDDLLLHFHTITDWKELVDAYEHGFKDAAEFKKTGNDKLAFAPSTTEEAVEYYKSTLESVGDLIGKQLAPKVQEMDKIGLKYDNGKVTFPKPMVDAMNAVMEAGLLPYAIGRHYGGLGMPVTVQSMAMEMVSRADGAFGIALACFNLAETLEKYGSKEQIEKYVPLMAEGKYCGAMALTEPDYGSDLPNLQTKATKDANGQWRINGAKRFITHGCGFGDKQSIILTLARTGSPTSGARGLSFFIVKTQDVHIASIEKKMGLHCSPTCEVVYENSPAELIGVEGHGLVKYSMGMMNTARLSIAAQSMGIASAAYYEAKKYASERVQFGKLIQEIPAVKKILTHMDREIVAMRCILLEASRTVDLYLWREEHLKKDGMDEKEIRKDETIRFWEKLANLFTPLSKYYISETANTIADNALQVHGGSGYTEDYDVSKIYRDARITNIYEGTTQLQIVACIGGVVAGMTPTGFLRAYLDKETSKFSPSEKFLRVRKTFEKIVETFTSIKESSVRDGLAFEVVESAARTINGMLIERSASRLDDTRSKERLLLAKEYHIDSIAILESNLIRIQERGVG
ncbi:MAG TPA: acyl-CoA dehydrogenase family protein [Leptospiraceae bacterium]|nr:acyl-CoA dehydrogenase family protein [Leptospiraceae bacterium]HMW03471.1 acyl-CoA dehydrogenase family protein [Leptospiraceae bacterium]HMX31604.1 acyl-CoA dehydrogenase family protein [Leptospiraceae bacterium]HMY29609.1 acyl-CoA dehydrogenase family protein [Leptospiraceae bacterium]HMZ62901.1 acyl-CoA dehydrogenase family protein [Leptospiraceae bacterium]